MEDLTEVQFNSLNFLIRNKNSVMCWITYLIIHIATASCNSNYVFITIWMYFDVILRNFKWRWKKGQRSILSLHSPMFSISGWKQWVTNCKTKNRSTTEKRIRWKPPWNRAIHARLKIHWISLCLFVMSFIQWTRLPTFSHACQLEDKNAKTATTVNEF